MKFKRDKKSKNDVNRDGSSCDVDLKTCAVVLDNGVIVEKKSEEYATLVNSLLMCDSPICGTTTLF